LRGNGTAMEAACTPIQNFVYLSCERRAHWAQRQRAAGLRAFLEAALREAGYQLDQVQHGREPDDWKPMNTIGRRVREIRVRDAAGAFRRSSTMPFMCCIVSRKRPRKLAGPIEPGRAALPGFVKGARSMSKKRFANVWDAIEDTPAQAENMKLRSALMMALKDHIDRIGLSQSEAGKLLGVTQPRISDLIRGKIELFGLDTLVNMIGAAGLHVEMRISGAA
jgi:predicted XRE-type DNA-binding protein